ncbi:MAG: hypothetical protein R2788_11285 [Saprospiraceae bacterium]
MKTKKALPFELLMKYAEGTLCSEESEKVALLLAHDPEAVAIVNGLKAIYTNEGMDSNALEKSFLKTEKQLEKKIQLHSNFSNHLIELNRQLRMAAAVFFFIFSFSFLSASSGGENHYPGSTMQHGPYDLALGSKIAP